jgi:hypothetical protein
LDALPQSRDLSATQVQYLDGLPHAPRERTHDADTTLISSNIITSEPDRIG